jgi:hypothetical protein
MNITLQQLQERLEKLRHNDSDAQILAANLAAQIAANQGAIQDCEHWIKILSEEESEAKKK